MSNEEFTARIYGHLVIMKDALRRFEDFFDDHGKVDVELDYLCRQVGIVTRNASKMLDTVSEYEVSRAWNGAARALPDQVKEDL